MKTRLIAVIAAFSTFATALLLNSPAASATTAHVVARYRLTPGFYSMAAGRKALWVLDADETHYAQLYRINPRTGTMRRVTRLPFPAGGLVVAFGSLWVSDYFGNAVWRVGPRGHVQAEIATGTQPQWMHAAFGSLWVANHHGASMSRIDPETNTVLDTVQVGAPDTFRDGPQAVTDDGTNVYVGSSNLQALQSVDPSDDAVTTPDSSDDVFCGPTLGIAGVVWSVDPCSGAFYQFGTDGSVLRTIPSAGVPGDIATLGGHLWVSDDTNFDPDTFQGSAAVLERLDPVTGEVERTVAIGGDATGVTAAFGDFWVYNANTNVIRRIDV
jgi:streptogramin lyase